MEGMPNRKQRRLIAKEAGLLKMKHESSLKDRLAMSRRASELGKKIHFSNVERNMRNADDIIQHKEQDKLLSLIENGKTPEEALKILQTENDSPVNGDMDNIG